MILKNWTLHFIFWVFFPRAEAYDFIKKETLTQVFSCEFCEISKDTFSTEHLWVAASSIAN